MLYFGGMGLYVLSMLMLANLLFLWMDSCSWSEINFYMILLQALEIALRRVMSWASDPLSGALEVN